MTNNAQFSVSLHSSLMNIDRITICRMGGQSTFYTAWFTYITHCDMIRTEILHWSQNSEFVKITLCCTDNPTKKPWVYVRFGIGTSYHQVIRVFRSSRTKPGLRFVFQLRPWLGNLEPLLTLVKTASVKSIS